MQVVDGFRQNIFVNYTDQLLGSLILLQYNRASHVQTIIAILLHFGGIRSERQFMETVHLNLAHRWYIGYDLDEPVADHSSVSKIHTRCGFQVFHRFYEKIVELCIEAGLVWGRELYFDGTKVRANTAVNTIEGRIELIKQA
jgi:transposase